MISEIQLGTFGRIDMSLVSPVGPFRRRMTGFGSNAKAGRGRNSPSSEDLAPVAAIVIAEF